MQASRGAEVESPANAEEVRSTGSMRRWPHELRAVGKEPDPRFTFANERTFLAWVRTSLALIAGGLAAAQVLRFHLGGAHLLVAVPAITLGGIVVVMSYRRWELNERSLRLGKPLNYSLLTGVLAVGIAILATTSAILVVTAALTAR
jgi:inner membrane protein YidH